MMVLSRATRNMQRKTETRSTIFLALFPSGGGDGVGEASGVLVTSSGCFVLGVPSSFRSETLGGVSGRPEAMALAGILRVRATGTVQSSQFRLDGDKRMCFSKTVSGGRGMRAGRRGEQAGQIASIYFGLGRLYSGIECDPCKSSPFRAPPSQSSMVLVLRLVRDF